MSAPDATRELRAEFDRWDCDGRQAVILTDNPGFDAAMVNYYLHREHLPDLNHGCDCQYRPIFDTDSYARGAMGKNYDNIWTDDSEVVKRFGLDVKLEAVDHLPENDAERIYRMHVGLMLTLGMHH